MAKEDFCFTYYDGDAARDKAHMNRLERGAYDDLISAQRKRGHLSVDDIKMVLSKDFDVCWAAMEWVLLKDEEGKFFIEWVDKSLVKMKEQSKKQKDRINSYWDKKKNQTDTKEIPRNNHGNDLEEPLEDVNENGDEEYKEEVVQVYKNPGDGKLFTIEHCVTIALNDERWVKANKTSKKELEEFNRLLEKRAEYQKNPADYKNHFANWKGKGKVDFTKNDSPPSGPSPSELRALEILKQVG